jgi:hypothetical protein
LWENEKSYLKGKCEDGGGDCVFTYRAQKIVQCRTIGVGSEAQRVKSKRETLATRNIHAYNVQSEHGKVR